MFRLNSQRSRTAWGGKWRMNTHHSYPFPRFDIFKFAKKEYSPTLGLCHRFHDPNGTWGLAKLFDKHVIFHLDSAWVPRSNKFCHLQATQKLWVWNQYCEYFWMRIDEHAYLWASDFPKSFSNFLRRRFQFLTIIFLRVSWGISDVESRIVQVILSHQHYWFLFPLFEFPTNGLFSGEISFFRHLSFPHCDILHVLTTWIFPSKPNVMNDFVKQHWDDSRAWRKEVITGIGKLATWEMTS